MKPLFYRFIKNIFEIFNKKNLIWHFLAIVSTYIIVISNFDWIYYKFFTNNQFFYFSFLAATIGGLLPIFLPITILILGKIHKNQKTLNIGFAIGQAVLIGSFVSSFYKFLTGRAHPDFFNISGINISHSFNLGFFNDVFWGWPSSHTTIAFAMVFCLWQLFPKNKTLKIVSLIYALYIGIGMTFIAHWFSDFTSGIIFGTLIGTVVGKAFRKRIE